MENTFIKSIPRTTVTLRPGDVGFRLHDGFIMADRAGFDIAYNCPQEYIDIILQAINRGWLKPVATVPNTDPTLMWDVLKS